MKSNFRNWGVKIGEKSIVQVAAKRDDYGHSLWQSNSLYNYHYSAVAPWSPFHGARSHRSQQFFSVSVHHFTTERCAPIPMCYLILYCNKRRTLSYNMPHRESSWECCSSFLWFAGCCPHECALDQAAALQEKRAKAAPRSLEQPKAAVSLHRVSAISV